jgi:hypothetical protein
MTHLLRHVYEACQSADSTLRLYFVPSDPHPTEGARLYEFAGNELKRVETQAEKVFPAFTVSVPSGTPISPAATNWTVQVGYYEPRPKTTDNAAPVLDRALDKLNTVLAYFNNRTGKPQGDSIFSFSDNVGGALLYGMQLECQLGLVLQPSTCE